MKTILIFLFLLCLIGIYLRFYNLNSISKKKSNDQVAFTLLNETLLVNGRTFLGENLYTLNNKKKNINDIFGNQNILVFIHSNISCNVCVDSLVTKLNSIAVNNNFKDKLIGIVNSNDINYVRRFARINKLRFQIYWDKNSTITGLNKINLLPVVLMINKNKVVVSSYFINPLLRKFDSLFWGKAIKFIGDI